MKKTAEKARNLAYRKPIVKMLNYDDIVSDLYCMLDDIADVSYFNETDEETLIDALDGDEDEAYEFKSMFSALEYDVSRTLEQCHEDQHLIPECFDDWFISCHAGSNFGGYIGYDSYEDDFVQLDFTQIVEEASEKRISRLSKKELIESGRICFQWFMSWISVKDRFDKLRSAFEILKGKNQDFLNNIKLIETIYNKLTSAEFYSEKIKIECEFDRTVELLPQEVWIQ